MCAARVFLCSKGDLRSLPDSLELFMVDDWYDGQAHTYLCSSMHMECCTSVTGCRVLCFQSGRCGRNRSHCACFGALPKYVQCFTCASLINGKACPLACIRLARSKTS